MRERVAGAGPGALRQRAVIAIAASVIVANMVNPDVYAAAGLDADAAEREAAGQQAPPGR